MLVIHGDNHLASRQKLAEELMRFRTQPEAQVVTFEGKNLLIDKLIQELESGSLFGTKKLVVIEKLFSGKSKDQKIIIGYLKKNNPEIIIWEDRKIDGRTLTSLKTKSLLFEIPSSLFQLLESFFPGNYRYTLSLLHKTLPNTPVELIFFMLVRHVKNLLIFSDSVSLSEQKIPEWRFKKLTGQAKMFGPEKLKQIYAKLLNIEYLIKSGQSNFKLESHLDLFFTSI